MNKDTIIRFWGKVKKTDSCWVWIASKRAKGYGAFVWSDEDGRIIQGRAHRFAYELLVGKIPQGMCVLHHCDNPACVNPQHLWLGTKKDNNLDMMKKGRHVHGSTYKQPDECKYKRGLEHWNNRLTPEIIKSIRKSRNAMSYIKLGKKFGISVGHAYRIVNFMVWKHVK